MARRNYLCFECENASAVEHIKKYVMKMYSVKDTWWEVGIFYSRIEMVAKGSRMFTQSVSICPLWVALKLYTL